MDGINTSSRTVKQRKPSSAWLKNLEQAEDFRISTGHLPKHSEDARLAQWVTSQRYRLTHDCMGPAQKLLFEALLMGIGAEQEDMWDTIASELLAYAKQHHRLPTESKYTSSPQSWYRQQKKVISNYSSDSQLSDRIEKRKCVLAAIEKELLSTWDMHILQLKEFISETGRCPRSSVRNEHALSAWICRQERNYYAGKLSEEKYMELHQLTNSCRKGKVSVKPHVQRTRKPFSVRLTELESFITANGRLPTSAKSSSDPNEKGLTVWLRGINARAKEGTLSEKDRAELTRVCDKVGFDIRNIILD